MRSFVATGRAALTPLAFLCSLLLASGASAGGKLTIQKPVGFQEGILVRDAIKQECDLQQHVPDFIAEFAKKQFDSVAFADKLEGVAGKVLFVEITDVSEMGNAFSGRQKALTIRGELREGGKVIGSFQARRNTMGGFMGGYKGNCGFVGRCAKALGKDVANWLEKPGMNDVLNF